MIAALAPLLLLGAQDAAADVVDHDEIVVTAEVGHVALIFDKGADGRLRNCRVFISSGVDRIDADACATLPECITSTGGDEYCGDGRGGAGLIPVDLKAKDEAPAVLGIGEMLEAEPREKPAVGPSRTSDDARDPNRLGKLPPPPRDETAEPVIRIGGANGESW